MYLRAFVILFCVSIFSTNLNAEWISLSKGKNENGLENIQKQEPQITKTIENGITKFNIKISGFEAKQLVENGKSFTSIDLLTGSETHLLPGTPDLPFITKNFAIPSGCEVKVNVKTLSEPQVLPNYKVVPVKEAFLEGCLEPDLYTNYSEYSSSELYPKANYNVKTGLKFRDFDMCQIQLFPMQYLASENKIVANTDFEIEVSFTSNSEISSKVSAEPIHISPSFAKLYESNIDNYEDLKKTGIVSEDGRDVMLVIAPDNFASSMNEFVEWKTRTGVYTIMTKFSEIGANSNNADIIYNYIKKAYDEWEFPPTYVLLVGDYGVFPVKYVTYLDYTLIDEDYFGKVSGDDYIPDIMVGRFPAKSLSILQTLVAKALKYEQTPNVTSDNWFKKAVMCSNDAYESQKETKRFTAQVLLEDGKFNSVDTLMSDSNYDPDNPWGGSNCTVTTQDILYALSAGRSFLNYRGEAWTEGWSTSCYSFTTNDLSSLSNFDKLVFVTNIGCGVNKFDYDQGNSFGEAFLKLGTATKQRGAIAFIGPSSNSHTTYNNRIDKGIYIGMFREGLTTPAQALLRGKMMMYNVFGADDHWVKYQFELFNVLGDPSIQIWRETPQYINLSKPVSVPIGYSQPEFIVTNKSNGEPMKNAKICLYSDEVYVVGYTNEEGKIKIPTNTTKVQKIYVTVTGLEVYPLMDSIMTITQTVHLYPFGKPEIIDNEGNNNSLINPNENCKIKFLIKNSGTGTATSVKASLTTEDDAKATISTINEIDLGNIEPNSDGKYAEFSFKSNEDLRSNDDIVFDLSLKSNEETFEYADLEKAAVCRLVFVSDSILEISDVQNHRLDPGETSYLFVKLKNVGIDEAKRTKVTLKCDSSFIQIIESEFTLDNIAAESESSQLARFKVKADESAILNTDVKFQLEFATDNQTYSYTDIDSFTVTIGEPNRMDPTGPDAYGYYAYSSDDVIYEQSPVYNWFEISSIGTQLTNMNYSEIQQVNLPFNTKYYGKTYNSVSVGLEGWFAFTSISSLNYTPQKMPSAKAPANMVAACWASYNNSNSSESKVLTYNDQTNHRFIIEWYNIKNRSYTNNNYTYDTYQAIILDPAYYTTATGDAEIIVLYKNVHMVSNSSVGIQNETKDDGVNYIYQGNFPKTGNIIDNEKAIKFTTEKPTTKKLLVESSDLFISDISIYPQPAENNVHIDFNNPKAAHLTLKVFAESGKEIISNDLGFEQEGKVNFNFNIDKSHFSNGVYILRILNSEQVIGSGKLIIKK